MTKNEKAAVVFAALCQKEASAGNSRAALGYAVNAARKGGARYRSVLAQLVKPHRFPQDTSSLESQSLQ